MNFVDQAQVTRRVYRMKTAQRFFSVVIGLFFSGVPLALAYMAIVHPNAGTPVALAISLVFMAVGMYIVALAMRWSLTIDGTRIEMHGVFNVRSVDRSEIEGFRTVLNRNRSYTQLVRKDGRTAISIQQSFVADDDFRAWMQGIPDLDQCDREALLDQISKDQELGATPEERLNALALAKRQNIVLFVIVLAAAFGINFGPAALGRICAIILALAPLISIYLCWTSPLLFAVFKAKTDPRAETFYALVISGLSLMFENRGRHFVSVQAALGSVVVISLVIVLAYFGPARKAATPGAFLALLFLAPLYGFGVTTVANALFDSSTGTVYSTQVVGQHKSSGRSTTYYLRLNPWGPVTTMEDVSVPARFYCSTSIGDTVCPELHAGSLHIPWFRIAPCASPQPIH